MTLGTTTVESIADSTPSIMEVDVNVRRIVDVRKIPTLSVKTTEGGTISLIRIYRDQCFCRQGSKADKEYASKNL